MLSGKEKRKLGIKAVTIGLLALVIFLLSLLADRPAVVERYYSDGFYPVVCHILHPLFNFLPFSIGDVLYIAVIIYLFYALFRLIKLALRRLFFCTCLYAFTLIIGVQTAILVFYLFWGMNYFRRSAGERLNLRDTSYTTPALKAVTAMLIDSANATRARLTAADLGKSNMAIYQTAVAAVSKLSADSVDFRTYIPAVKPSLLTPVLNYIGTSGYFNPFTGEAQINFQQPVFNRPVVACHEMSHQMGYGAEDEADFVGFLAGIHSNDRLLRYSAYHLAVDEFMHALRYRDSTAQKELKLTVSPAVYHDFVIERDYWFGYQTKAEVVTGIFYDNFLKANNQPQGLNTYNRMILLVMALYGKDHNP